MFGVMKGDKETSNSHDPRDYLGLVSIGNILDLKGRISID